MARENLEQNEGTESADTNNAAFYQIGRREVSDATGAFHRAGVKVTGITQNGKNGDAQETLDGTIMEQKFNTDLGAGKKEFVFDLAGEKNIDAAQIKKLQDDGDKARQHGAKVKLTSLTGEQVTDLRTKGVGAHNVELFSKEQNDKALNSKSSPSLETSL